MKENTAKNFVIQLGSLIALYVSVTSLLILIFAIINLKFPDELAYYWSAESARESIRMSIAILIVFFPTYITLTRLSNQARRKEDEGKYNGLAKWLVYLSLLAGGAIVLGDLVTILIYLLNGEVTTRFLLKAFALLVVVSATFSYYLLDVRGHFTKREKESIMFGGGALVFVVVILLFGFMNIETPSEVRQLKLDDQQVTDLQNIQYNIEEYYRVNNELPEGYVALFEGVPVPTAPEGRDAYEYTVTGETTYELCATFFAPTQSGSDRSLAYPAMEKNYNWNHTEGRKCFERVIIETNKI